MNFGLENLRKLIEDFLADSGGRRGREREQQRQERGDEFAGDEPAAETQAQGGDSTQAVSDDDGNTESTSETDSGGGIFSRGSSGGETEDLDDLFYRIEELEEQLESKSSQLGSVRDSQEQVADQVEDVNDTVRQLLGVYDQVTDDVNPFTGEGEEENGFGVFGEDDKGADQAQSGFGLDAVTDGSGATDETVSFDDLKGVIEDAAEAQPAGGQTITFEEDEDADDTHVEVQATESVDQPDESAEVDADGTADGDEPSDVTLTTLADTYATDIILFEWLTQLVRTAGSAATLRAISYYAEIGWINEDVKTHLEGVLSGPDLDIHVDPETTPDELTAEDHADSYTYIMKLQEIHKTKREVEPEHPTESEPGP